MYQQINVLKELHYRIKLQCAKENRTMLEVVSEAIESYLKEKAAQDGKSAD